MSSEGQKCWHIVVLWYHYSFFVCHDLCQSKNIAIQKEWQPSLLQNNTEGVIQSRTIFKEEWQSSNHFNYDCNRHHLSLFFIIPIVTSAPPKVKSLSAGYPHITLFNAAHFKGEPCHILLKLIIIIFVIIIIIIITIGPFWALMAILGPELPRGPRMAQRMFQRAHNGPEGPEWSRGPRMAQRDQNGPEGPWDLKWPRGPELFRCPRNDKKS